MTRTSERKRIKGLDKQIVEIASWLAPARLLNPTMASRREAWERFRRAYNRHQIIDPELEYLPLPVDVIARSHRALDALTFGETQIDGILSIQARQVRLQLQLLEARGTARFGEVAANIHGLPDEELRSLARGILDGSTSLQSAPDEGMGSGPRLSAHAMAGEMKAALTKMGIHGWRVTLLGEMSARMSVSARHREVRIKSDSFFSTQDRDRLIVHELGTHVRRACNGFSTGLMNLGLGLRRYMATEEGLASIMEQKHGLLRHSMTLIYAYRALGAHLGHHYGFADTFRKLMEMGSSPEVAWDVTIRVKRGLTDTSIAGANPKDYVYLQGHRMVSDFLASGGSEDDLFIGKIAIEQIPQVKSVLREWDFQKQPET